MLPFVDRFSSLNSGNCKEADEIADVDGLKFSPFEIDSILIREREEDAGVSILTWFSTGDLLEFISIHADAASSSKYKAITLYRIGTRQMLLLSRNPMPLLIKRL